MGILCGLTFELGRHQRCDARARMAKMYRVPPDRAWWPAVGAPLERWVRPHVLLEPESLERLDLRSQHSGSAGVAVQGLPN